MKDFELKLNYCCRETKLTHCCLLQDDSVAQEADLLGNVATARDFGRQVLSLLAVLVQKYKY